MESPIILSDGAHADILTTRMYIAVDESGGVSVQQKTGKTRLDEKVRAVELSSQMPEPSTPQYGWRIWSMSFACRPGFPSRCGERWPYALK